MNNPAFSQTYLYYGLFHATSSLLFVADEVTFTITVIIIRMSDQIIKLNESNKYKPASGFGGGMLVWLNECKSIPE